MAIIDRGRRLVSPTMRRASALTDGSPVPSSHTAGSLTRRSFLAGGLGLGLGAPAAIAATEGAGAQSAALPFGSAIQMEYFDSDPAYRQLFLDQCDLIMPMNELTFLILQPARGEFNFEPADRLVDFAVQHGRLSRGHTFVWWGMLPDWVKAIEDPKDAERVLVEHIERTADRYKGRLVGWNVVNEVMANDPTEAAPLRDTYWMRKLGARHVDLAFRTAAAVDPGARLVINDYDLALKGERYDIRRKTLLGIVRGMLDRGVPVHAVGMQGHLYSDLTVDIEAVAGFGEALKRLGLGLIVTELDMIDRGVPGGPEEEDAAAFRAVYDLLDGLFAGQAPEMVVCWGLTDRYNWVRDVMPRYDGKPTRPLPFDADLKPKAWYGLLRRRLAEGR